MMYEDSDDCKAPVVSRRFTAASIPEITEEKTGDVNAYEEMVEPTPEGQRSPAEPTMSIEEIVDKITKEQS